jgi:REP element-mobilizing transposase RayT
MNSAITIGFRRRHLPHWTVAERTYFVTMRLKGSLPAAVVRQLDEERDALLATGPNPDILNDFSRARLLRIEAILDAAQSGPTFLNVAQIADVMVKAFDWLGEKKGWLVHAFTVMPNHIHVLLRNVAGKNHLLNEHLGVLKGYTAHEANRLLRRTGAFWMDENFDHWCRTDERVQSAAEYIRQNPVKAGLVLRPEEWPWTRVGRAFLPDQDRSGRNA